MGPIERIDMWIVEKYVNGQWVPVRRIGMVETVEGFEAAKAFAKKVAIEGECWTRLVKNARASAVQ